MMKRYLALFAVLCLTVACSHGEESECSKYVSLLGGTNPRSVFESVSEKKCQDAVPILKGMFDPGQGKYNKEILRVITEIWDPNPLNFKAESEEFSKKKPLYLDILKLALQSPETAVVAASSIEEWALQDLRPDLVKFLRDDLLSSQAQYAPAYAPALRAVCADNMGGYSEDLEDVYLAMLDSSPDIQGIEVNKLAATALGEIKTSNPEAIKALIRGLFIVSKDGGTVFKESLHSLLAIGPPAVPHLVDIVESRPGDPKVRYMEEFAVKNAISEWKWRKGMRISMLLAQLRDPRAAAALVTDIARPVIEPPNLPDSLRQDWTIAQTNRIKFDSWGIMSVANPGVMRQALKIMRDRSTEGSARLQLGLGLAFSFTPEAFSTLLRVCYEPEIDEDEWTEEQIALAEKDLAELGAPAKEADFIIRFAQPLAYAVGPGELEAFTDVFVDGFEENFGEEEKAEDITEKLEQIDIKVLLAVPRACRRNLECYLNVFKGGPGKVEGREADKYDPESVEGIDLRETEYVQAMGRAKAALVLGRWKANKKNRILILKAFASEFSALPYDDELYGDLRQIILLGFERVAVKSKKGAVKILRELMAKEEKKGKNAVKVWNQRLDALVFYVENYEAPAPEVKKADSKKAAPDKKAAGK